MICIQDYPEKLPDILPQILDLLGREEEKAIYAGLQGLFALCSRYEFELDEQREPLYDIVKQTFEKIGLLVNGMMGHMEKEDALYMLHLICKVFYVSNQL